MCAYNVDENDTFRRSVFLHFARRFWNQTWGKYCKLLLGAIQIICTGHSRAAVSNTRPARGSSAALKHLENEDFQRNIKPLGLFKKTH